MNIILAGYGKMGSLIHTLINEEKRDKVVGVIDPHSDSDAVTAETVCRESLSGGDAVIDFSSPSTVLDNIKVYAEAGIPAVIGTTGWYDHMDEVKELAERNGARLICSANFSIGVAIFLSLAEQSAKLINEFDSYDVSVHEIHHRMKADAPSGTALMIAERLLSGIERKTGIQKGIGDGGIRPELIGVTSERVGSVPGIHTITIDSSEDTITLTHSARSRMGFAAGAVRACHWLMEQESGVYTMDDMVGTNLRGGSNA